MLYMASSCSGSGWPWGALAPFEASLGYVAFHMEHLTLVHHFCSQIHFVDRLGPLPAKSGLLTCDNWLMKTSSRGGSRILLVNSYPMGNECS